MKKFFFLLGLSLGLTSCFKGDNTVQRFKEKSFPYLISTFDGERNELYVNNDKVIERPGGIYTNLFLLKVIDINGEEESFCLFYKIPRDNDSSGVLRLVRDHLGQCKDNFDEKIVAELTGLKKMKAYLYDEGTIIDGKKFDAQTLYLIFDLKEKVETLKYPLANYRGEAKISYKRYAPSFDQRNLKGMTISSVVLNKHKKKVSKIQKTKGSFGDHYLNNSLEICHSYGDNCQENQDYQCDRCRYGWFSAIPNISCDKVTLKFCGQNRCGEKGMPACVRGDQSAVRMGLIARNRCYDGSPAGYCNQGLKTVCDGKILICL